MRIKDGFGNVFDLGEESKSYDLSPLVGKKCIAIGDSYTYALTDKNSDGALTRLNESLGMTETLNHGIVGCTVRDKSDKGYASYPMVCRVCHTASQGDIAVGAQVPWDIDDVGYIWFMGGTNDDWIYPSTTGTDPCDSDQTHLYGALNLIFQTLIEKYPNIPIIIGLEPCYWAVTDNVESAIDKTSDYETVHRTDVKGLSREVLSCHMAQNKQKIVREVAELYAQAYPNLIRICDFCFNWYKPLDALQKSDYWSADKLHLTSKGYSALVTGSRYDSIEKALKSIFTV